MCDIKWSETETEWLISRVPTYLHCRAKWRSSLDSQGMDRQRRLGLIKAGIMMLKGWGAIGYPVLPVSPTWGGSVPIQQVVIFSGVEVHDDAGSIKQLLVTAGAGDAVVTVPAVSSVIQLLRLHLAMHPSPGRWGGRKKKREDGGDTQTAVVSVELWNFYGLITTAENAFEWLAHDTLRLSKVTFNPLGIFRLFCSHEFVRLTFSFKE